MINIAGRVIKYRPLVILRPVRGPAQYWKDLKMFVLTRQRGEANAVEKGTETTMGDVRGKKAQPGTPHGMPKRVALLSQEMRKENVHGIRQQLAENKYDIGQALNAIANRPFDLAIVDISLNGASSLELTEVIKSRWPNMPVVIFSSHDELFYVRNAFRTGARGYIVKLVDSTEEILTAIRHVLDGGIYISRRITQKFSADEIKGHQLSGPETLTNRPEYGTDQKQD